MKNWEKTAIDIFLIVIAIEGAMRFYLTNLGFPQAIYLKDMVAVLILAAAVMRYVVGEVPNRAFLAMMLFLGIYSTLGFIRELNWQQIAFGAKIFMPLALGLLTGNYLQSRRLQRVLWVTWLITVVGVFIDLQFDLPWVGLAYDIGNVEVRASKQWTTFGVDRLSGFSRSSVSAASLLLFLWLIAFGRWRPLVRFTGWVITGTAIFYTTSKGILASLAVVGLAEILLAFRPGRFLCRIGIFLLATAMLGLPILSGPTLSQRLFQGNMGPLTLESFGVRLREMWPYQFATLAPHPLTWLGMGFGYAGTAAMVYQGLLLPGDNLFVYLYFIMGALSAIMVIALAAQIAKLANAPRHQRVYFLIGLAIFIDGVTSNVLENTSSCFFLGCLLGHISTVAQQPGTTAPPQPGSAAPAISTGHGP